MALLLLGSSLKASPLEPKLLFHRKVGSTNSMAFVAKGLVTRTDLERLYSRYSHSAEMILQIQVFPSDEMARALLSGKRATDLDETDWYKQYLSFRSSLRSPNMSEIIEMGPDVVVRKIVDYTLEQSVTAGTNPLLCVATGNKCEVIWINIGSIPPSQKGYSEPRINLFILMGRLPTLREADEIYRNLRKRFRTKLLIASFRSDPWFIEDLPFPVMYPFLAKEPVVRFDDLKIRDEVMCLVTISGPECQ